MCVYLIIQSIFPDSVLVSYPSNERTNERTTCSSKNSWNSVTIKRLIKDGMKKSTGTVYSSLNKDSMQVVTSAAVRLPEVFVLMEIVSPS